jgi:hypothetical protein
MRAAGLDLGNIRVFTDSLVVTREGFVRDVEFFEGVALKMLKSTHAALNRVVTEEGLSIPTERKKAIDAFLWWEHGDG